MTEEEFKIEIKKAKRSKLISTILTIIAALTFLAGTYFLLNNFLSHQ